MNQLGTRTEPFGGPVYSPTIAWDSGLPSSAIRFNYIAPDPCLPLLRFVAARAKAVSERALVPEEKGSPVISGDLICVGGHGLWTLPRLWKTPETGPSDIYTRRERRLGKGCEHVQTWSGVFHNRLENASRFPRAPTGPS